jgi:hypothetical protein
MFGGGGRRRWLSISDGDGIAANRLRGTVPGAVAGMIIEACGIDLSGRL